MDTSKRLYLRQESILKHFTINHKKKYAPTQRVDDTHGEMQHSTDFITDLPWRTIEFLSGEAVRFRKKEGETRVPGKSIHRACASNQHLRCRVAK